MEYWCQMIDVHIGQWPFKRMGTEWCHECLQSYKTYNDNALNGTNSVIL